MATTRTRLSAIAAALAAVSLAVACGDDSPTDPSDDTPPTATTTLTITTSGVTPRTIVVSRGAQVTIVNNDTRNHNMTSDPHPTHTDCPEINQVGLLTPGQSKQTGNLTTARTCGFHDHDSPGTTSLQGSIVIQ